MANDKFIKEIADKLQNHASEVNPQMWHSISSQIGAGAAGAGASSAIGIGKVAAIVIGTAAIAVASYFVVTSNQDKPKETTKLTENTSKENTNSTIDNKAPEVKAVPSEEKTVDKPLASPIQEQPNRTITPQANSEVHNPSVMNPVKEMDIPTVKEPIHIIPKTNTKDETIVNSPRINITTSTQNKTIDVEPNKEVVVSSSEITKLLNVFSPNNDGINDFFFIESTGLSNFSLVVLDKNNIKVWQTTDPDAQWDGRDMSGQLVEAGSYIYFVAADGPNGKKIGEYQKLTITR